MMQTMDETPGIIFRVAERSLRYASVRYRGLLPACAAADEGLRVSCIAPDAALPADAGLLYAVKPLLSKDEHYLLAAKSRGVPIVIDLCDNVFIPDYANQGSQIGDRFRKIARYAALVTVPGPALRECVHECTGIARDRIVVVPDIVEDAEGLGRQARLLGVPAPGAASMRERLGSFRAAIAALVRRTGGSRGPRRILWFGNHGAPHAQFGISDILIFRDALESLARETQIELWVVSNSLQKYQEMIRPMAVPTRYFEWSEGIVGSLLPLVDATIVPNSLDPFSRTKSANRALKSLAAGVPVVATPTDAYANLAGAIWTADPGQGLREYLSSRDSVRAALATARSAIQTHYSYDTLRKVMRQVITQAVPT